MYNFPSSMGNGFPSFLNFNGGEGTLVTDTTQPLVVNTPTPGLCQSGPMSMMPGQSITTQLQQRNINATETTHCYMNPVMHSAPADNRHFTNQPQPCKETPPMLTSTGIYNPNPQCSPGYPFSCPDQGASSLQSPPVSGLRPDSQDPLLSSGVSIKSNRPRLMPDASPKATAPRLPSQRLAHFSKPVEANLPRQVSRVSLKLPLPPNHPLVSQLNATVLGVPATPDLTFRPTPEIGNHNAATVNPHNPARKSPRLLSAVAQAISNTVIPQLKTEITSTVKATIPEVMQELVREQIKSEVTHAVKAMLPVLQQQINQVVSSSITAIIPGMQTLLVKSVSEAIRPLLETRLEEVNKQLCEQTDKILTETTEKHIKKAFEENFAQYQAQQKTTEASSSNSSSQVLENLNGPPLKKMRTSGESMPVSEPEVKRNQINVTKLSSEVSKFMGIKPLSNNECSVGKILQLAARLIDNDMELLLRATKPRTKRQRTNMNHQERMKLEKDRKKRMHKQIHSGIEELGNSVRRFSEQHLKETRPGHDSNPDEIIEKACSILHDKNKNTLEVPSIKRKGLRSAGKGTTLSEYHKNLKAFLAKQKSEPEDTGSPKNSEAETPLASKESS
ncbi:hypothetical protein [Endozoicomonas sp. GU-1]|uniref:hypothetical protein n=1 Tax=Endozoicomonas sp. GU-1 TaxID=3009078 RepID=UPI0022B37CF5|nr:hypothetical protein [Endozoicomonas sp. GU-1]WBA81045.1 hypothetical protein O2T12_22550 [Endozoicomonas sp. GU-1]WBA88610.1 hypothetical protein O3276_11735 [Endozoicomonas sp. GU-1]